MDSVSRIAAPAATAPARPPAAAAGAIFDPDGSRPYALDSFMAVFSATNLCGSGFTAPSGICAEPNCGGLYPSGLTAFGGGPGGGGGIE